MGHNQLEICGTNTLMNGRTRLAKRAGDDYPLISRRVRRLTEYYWTAGWEEEN